MKVVEFYFHTKTSYSKYIVLMKIGNFVEVYGDDTKILNNLFNYKISNYGNTKRSGFPKSSLTKVLNKLEEYKINYVLFEKFEILEKKKFSLNNYDKYIDKIDIKVRMKNIISKLNKSIDRYDINEILNKIDDLL